MAIKAKSKIETLWKHFEKSGSIEAFLNYKLKTKAKKDTRVKSKR